ncbi:MAG: hypothetical protein NVSMB25_10750 [Thermoleophilaceae bacterium]
MLGSQLRVARGEGLVGRAPGAVFAVEADTAGDHQVVTALAEGCGLIARDVKSSPEALASRLRSLALAAAPGPKPSFAVLLQVGDAATLVISGHAQATLLGEKGAEKMTALSTGGWLEVEVPSSIEGVILGDADASGEAGLPLDLEEGIVPGAGAALEAAVAPSVAPTDDRSSDQDDAAGALPFVTLLEPPATAARDPLPVVGAGDDAPGLVEPDAPTVEGILCGRGHFNHPAAAYCAQCGLSMTQRTHYLVSGPRPPLGLLVADDGSAYTLDAGYLLGRNPTQDAVVTAGGLRSLQVHADDVADVHAEVRLDGWEVKLLARDPDAATLLQEPEAPGWTTVPPNTAVKIVPGAAIRVGPREFVYHSHRER